MLGTGDMLAKRLRSAEEKDGGTEGEGMVVAAGIWNRSKGRERQAPGAAAAAVR